MSEAEPNNRICIEGVFTDKKGYIIRENENDHLCTYIV